MVAEPHTTARLAIDGAVLEPTVASTLAGASQDLAVVMLQRDRLLALLSHDLRSPHAAIIATLSHPDLQGLPDRPKQVIEKAARRALHMIDSAVRLVRAESDDYILEPIEVSYVLEEAIDRLWSKRKETKVEINLEPPTSEFVVMLDREITIRAFTAVLGIIIKNSIGGRPILCRLESASILSFPAVCCRIINQVASISQVDLARSFNRLATDGVQAIEALGDPDGIAFARVVVSRHGGDLIFESSLENPRTTMITFPLSC